MPRTFFEWRALMYGLSLLIGAVPGMGLALSEFERVAPKDPASMKQAESASDESALSGPRSGLVAEIREPGPDLANFPNSSYTLPAGGIYLESSPLSYYGSTVDTPAQWNISYLLRYGLIDEVELRLFSNGVTFRSGEVGTSPLAFDTKAHLWRFDCGSLNASIGVEAYVQPSDWLSTSDFRQPLQFGATLLVDHQLPWDIAMGWNVGFTRTYGQEAAFTRPTVQWAFQRNLTDDFALFIQGFHNAATLPNVPVSRTALIANRQVDVVGFGGQWMVNERFALFGNINWGVTSISPSEIASLGFALAF